MRIMTGTWDGRHFVRSGLIAWLAAMVLASTGAALTEEARDLYVQGLRTNGFADLAIEFLERELQRPELTTDQKADLEFGIAESLIAKSQGSDDLNNREGMLDAAAAKFAEVLKKYPNHQRQSEALVQSATIALLKGRLGVLRAQQPANSGRVEALAKAARQQLERAADEYYRAYEGLLAKYKKLPVYVPPEDKETQYQKKKLFNAYIDARFQSGLSRFYLADSYLTIELPVPTSRDGSAMAEYQATKREWSQAFAQENQKARKLFEDIAEEHRREVVGLYAQLWMARCMAADGDHRRAMGIYDLLLEHDNVILRKLQRDVFFFNILSMAARKEYDGIIARVPEWLSRNSRYSKEPSYLGVQFELARARIAKALADAPGTSRDSELATASRILDYLASTSNEYSGLARREQFKLADMLGTGPAARSFNQQLSLANTKLDLVTPTLSPAEKQVVIREAIDILYQAIRTGEKSETPDAIAEAWTSVAYSYILMDDFYSGAVAARSVLRDFGKTRAARTGLQFAVVAYLYSYERATKLNDSHALRDLELAEEVVATHGDRFRDSKELSEALLAVGRARLARRQYEKAVAWFEKAGPNAALRADIASMAGLSLWEWYRTLGADESTVNKEELRTKAKDRLSEASAKFHASPGGRFERPAVLNDAFLADVYYDLNQDADALAILNPIIAKIDDRSLPASVEPRLRINILTTALQCAIRQGRLDDTDRLVEMIGKQQGQEEAGNVTAVFISLASRLQEQMTRLKAAGDQGKYFQTANTYESFLNRLADRQSGQTIDSLLFLAGCLLDIGKAPRAVDLLTRAKSRPEAASEQARPMMAKADLLLVRAYRLAGEYDKAKPLADKLFLANPSAPDVLLERGNVLEAAGDTKNAIIHWKAMIQRMKDIRPRPDDFYLAVDRLLRLYKELHGPERAVRAREGFGYTKVLLASDASMPDNWRTAFEKHQADFTRELGPARVPASR